MQQFTSLDVAPIIPLWLLAAAGGLSLLALLPAFLRRARGVWWRAAAFAALLLALANPRLVEETREVRPDIALLVMDASDSTMLAPGRAAAMDAARRTLETRLGRLDNLELRVVEVPEGGNQGTRLFTALERALADTPRARLAGVLAVTDGQVHDVPATPPLDAPFHVLLPGRPGEVDRRLRLIEAPGFGIVGRSVELRVAVDDLGVTPPGGAASGAARLTIRRDGAAPRQESLPVGREHRIEVPIERGGPTVLELMADTLPGEVSDANNRAVITINGVRDRLRVLLVSGEPHAGERTWRRLLKADPGVDLVHFTILRPPEKDDSTPLNELALIAFPVRELFQVKLREFDLVVFDRFANRGILPPAYMRNIAEYVRSGGALLVSVGPEFSGPASLANTPLAAVLPARPVAPPNAIQETPFRPRVSEAGRRHPVTDGLQPGPEPEWGRWYRHLRSEARGGTTVMEGPDGAPLVQLDRVGQGRVALMLSDHIWLWARGHEGGGPHQELLRRMAHWLMREPELEEEDLTARIEGGRMQVVRRSLDAGPPPEVVVTAPDGSVLRMPLGAAGGGRTGAEVPAVAPGMWQVSDGRRQAYAAAVPANPPELADLRASPERLAGLATSVRWLGDGAAVPELRRVAAGRDMAGAGPASWIGLRRNADHTVTGISAVPLLPPWLALPLLLGLALLAWRREAR